MSVELKSASSNPRPSIPLYISKVMNVLLSRGDLSLSVCGGSVASSEGFGGSNTFALTFS